MVKKVVAIVAVITTPCTVGTFSSMSGDLTRNGNGPIT